MFCGTIAAFPGTSLAITAEDVTNRMTQVERKSYLDGLIDMLAYRIAREDDREKGNCIIDKFYREGMEDSWSRLLDVLDQYPERRPEILVTVLAEQLCGE